MRFSAFCLFFAWLHYCGQQQAVFGYKIPKVKLEILPQGFRVSIPHESGIENVAFNINRNRPFKAFEPGEFSERIPTLPPAANRWSFESKRHLHEDDVIYMWTDVQFNKIRYRSLSGPMPVKDLSGENSPNVTENKPSNTTAEDDDEQENECEPSLTVTNQRQVCKGQLIFEDNFDGLMLDASRWRYEVRLPLDIADAEFVLYDTNVELSQGMLKIEPKIWGNDNPNADIRRGHLDLGSRCTPCRNPELECQRQPFGRIVLPPVLTARINTKHAFNFKYGRVEVRAKLPKGDWLFPLLLLEPLANYYGQESYASGQMRIAFLRSNLNLQTSDGVEIGGRVLYGGAVLRPESHYRDAFMVNTSREAHFGDIFHIYSLTWTDNRLSLAVDGQNYGEVVGDFVGNVNGQNNAWMTGSFMAPLDQEFFITLGVAAGGLGDFPDILAAKPWTNTSPKAALNFWRDRQNWKTTWTSPALQVDYVRVYAV